MLEVSGLGYCNWISNSEIRKENEIAERKFEQVVAHEFTLKKRRYGAPHINDSLNKKNIPCKYKKVVSVLRKLDLYPVGYKKFKVTTTNSNHKYRVFDNLLNRTFLANKLGYI